MFPDEEEASIDTCVDSVFHTQFGQPVSDGTKPFSDGTVFCLFPVVHVGWEPCRLPTSGRMMPYLGSQSAGKWKSGGGLLGP